MIYKSPLSIYIVWHPKFSNGLEIANMFYSTLYRNPDNPFVRTLGIPVYYRSEKELNANVPKKIEFNDSDYVAIIPLISDEFILDDDYCEYLDGLVDSCTNQKIRIFPVALSKSAFNITSKMRDLNFIRAYHENGLSDTFGLIKSNIFHELCRLLMNLKKGSEEVDTLELNAPIKLFLSHSKHDESMNDAIEFRDYISSKTQLKTFFDTNDISYGSLFEFEIKNAIKESALVVFQSDSYSDREWCRVEVLTAKKHGCPIVIVNAVKKGEKRAFPYLGNYPSVRFNNNFQDIIDLTLEQVLFNKHTNLILDSLTDLYKLKVDKILSNAPELFNFIQLKSEKRVDGNTLIIYPDPPLGFEEIEILNQMDNNFVFITPTYLPSILIKNK